MMKEEVGDLVGEIEEQKERYGQLEIMSKRELERAMERDLEERGKMEKTIKEK